MRTSPEEDNYHLKVVCPKHPPNADLKEVDPHDSLRRIITRLRNKIRKKMFIIYLSGTHITSKL